MGAHNTSPVTDPVHDLVHAHLGLAQPLAGSFAGPYAEIDDLRQVAYLGLVKASRGYDPDRGTGFLAYAIPTITGEIRRHLRDACYPVRPPRRIHELRGRMPSAREFLAQSLHQDPTFVDLARFLGTTIKDVSTAAGFTTRPAPLTHVTARAVRDREAHERVELTDVLAAAFRALGPTCRRIVHLRFFHGLTQQQIAREVGVSQMHVSRLLASSLVTMRETLEVAP